MSVVTGIVLICSLVDAEGDEGLLQPINDWLRTGSDAKRAYEALVDMSDQSVGSKHPQFYMACAGYNAFPEDDFVRLFLSIEWGDPDNAVLIMQPENGRTRIFRPGDAAPSAGQPWRPRQ